MRRREFLEAAIWAVVLFAVYLAIISTISPTEIVVGAITGAAWGAVAVLTRRMLLASDDDEIRPRAGWLRWLLRLPEQTLSGFVRVLSHPRGAFTEVHLPEDERPAARRGFTSLALSVAPDMYVADVDPDRNTLIVHRIGDRPSALEREVTR
jgi:multisubunit Na+/H+ antiporter MnhE subunit